MNKKPSYITRIDHERTHGWWVRLGRGIWVQKFFPDKRLGGKGKALGEARAYRDSLLPRLAPKRHKEDVKRTRPYGYIHKVNRRYYHKESNQYKYYAAWGVWCRSKDETIRSTSYSIGKYGAEARDMANNKLQEWLNGS